MAIWLWARVRCVAWLDTLFIRCVVIGVSFELLETMVALGMMEGWTQKMTKLGGCKVEMDVVYRLKGPSLSLSTVIIP